MVTGCQGIKGCIAYIGISYLAKTTAAKLGTASLANKAGKFAQPTAKTIDTALASFSAKTPANGSQSLINTSAAKGYPIINYEYVVVKKAQPSACHSRGAEGLPQVDGHHRQFGSTFLAPVGFEPLPSNVKTIAENQIASISG